MKDISYRENLTCEGNQLDAIGCHSVIILVGGSISKRRLFEQHILGVGHQRFSIVHLNPPSQQRRGREGAKTPWDPREYIGSLSDAFRIAAVIPMIDSVVCYCDSMNAKLGLSGNDPKTSLERVDKQKMQKACADVGLVHAKSVRVSSINQAIRVWQDSFGSNEVVLKPPRSGGCDGIAICSSIVEISEHMNRQLNAVNLEKLRNTDIVIQELIMIDYEYVINTVSLDGIHFVSDVWRGTPKRNGRLFLYDTQELVFDLASVKEIIEYTKSVLSAVGVRHGACHTEVGVVMNSKNNTIESIKLIEVNSRLAGEMRASNVIPGWRGEDQIYWLLISLIDPARLLKEGIPRSDPAYSNTVIVVFLQNTRYLSCSITDIGLEAIRRLPSFFRFGRSLGWANETVADKKSVRLGRTLDLVSSPGVVMLVGPSASQDASEVRRIEASLLYDPTHAS